MSVPIRPMQTKTPIAANIRPNGVRMRFRANSNIPKSIPMTAGKTDAPSMKMDCALVGSKSPILYQASRPTDLVHGIVNKPNASGANGIIVLKNPRRSGVAYSRAITESRGWLAAE
jgi:hypothetical protein